MLAGRVAAFVRGESGDSFEKLALAVFRFQFEQNAAFRAWCDERGAAPERIADWQEVPGVPVSDLARLGTAEQEPFSDLRRTVIDRTFPTCLEGLGRPPVLSLIAAGEEPPDRWLGFLADHVLGAWAAPDSSAALARRGVEVAKARSFLAARQRDGRPTLVLGTAATLELLLAALDRRGLRFRLPPGSRVAVMDGRGTDGTELLGSIAEGLAVPPDGVVRAYGVGPASRFYAGHRRRGQPRPFRPPPWVRVRLLDPDSLAEVPAGSAGAISVFDLANLGTAPHLLAADSGIASEEGFQLAAGGSPTWRPISG